MSPTATHYLLLIISVFGSVWAFQVVYRFFLSPAEGEAGALAALTPKRVGDLSAFDGVAPSGGFLQRLDYFLIHNLGMGQRIEDVYMLMGRPAKPTPLQILHYQEMAAIIIPIFLYILLETPFAILSMPLGFLAVEKYYRGKAQERQRLIVRSFPTFVDLAALTIESGLDYMSAFDRIVRSATKKSELDVEVEKMLGEIQLGYSRREALRRMAMRTGLQDVRSFVGLIIQSDELGTSLVDLLRNFSSDMRFRRMNSAEKAAAQASTKMLFPIFLFIFPTVFVLMLAPMLKNLFKGGLGF